MKRVTKFLKGLLCRNGFHIWQDKSNADESWHECLICNWQIEFTEQEYNALKTLNQALKG